jgi:hypothetical protein
MKYTVYLNYIFIYGVLFLPHNLVLAAMDEVSKIDAPSHENKDKEPEKNASGASKEDEQLLLEDEKLSEEILNIISFSYKEVIDLSALYFCGLIDSDKLYDQIITLAHKDFFKIIKLFSWYIPSILKNPKISKFVKFKKSLYVGCCILTFWYVSKEVFQGKVVRKGIKIDPDEVELSPRQRPSINL